MSELKTKQERTQSILNNTFGKIDIEANPKADKEARKFLEDLLEGNKIAKIQYMVYGNKIEKEAAKQAVDPRLVKAIMYMEVSHGGIYGYPAEILNKADIILPMNIRSMWLPLGKQGADLKNIDDNIQIGVTLIKRIQDRLENPTVEKIATLYNSLAKDKVTDYGARVGEIYRTQPWKSLLRAENKINEPIIKTAENSSQTTSNKEWKPIPLNIEQSDERYVQIKQHIENILTDKFSVLNESDQHKLIVDFIEKKNQHHLEQAKFSAVNYINEEVQERAAYRTV